jgi:hypothetical protein
VRSSKAHVCRPSLPPSPCPLPPPAPGSRAWPTPARRVASSAHALGDRPTAPAREHSPALVSWIKAPCRRGPSRRQGGAAPWPQWAPNTPGDSAVGRGGAVGATQAAQRDPRGAGGSSLGSMKPHRSAGAWPCPVPAGGGRRSAHACRRGRCARARAHVRRPSPARRGGRLAPGAASPAAWGCAGCDDTPGAASLPRPVPPARAEAGAHSCAVWHSW